MHSAKTKYGIAKSAVEAEQKRIQRRRKVQEQKILQAFDELQKTIDEKKQEVLNHFKK